MAAVPGDSIRVSVRTDREAYTPGERIVMDLRVDVTGRDSVVLEFPTSQRYDLAIVDAGGKEVWRWSRGRAFLQAFGLEVIRPEGVRWSESWVTDAPAGRYRVIARLTLASGSASDTVFIEVRDRVSGP